jgi:hypothetical protein
MHMQAVAYVERAAWQSFSDDGKCRLLGMREVVSFPVQSRGSSPRTYLARLLIRNAEAYKEQRASQEGMALLTAQRHAVEELSREAKEIARQRRRRAEEQAEQWVEEAAVSGTRMSVRQLTTKILRSGT